MRSLIRVHNLIYLAHSVAIRFLFLPVQLLEQTYLDLQAQHFVPRAVIKKQTHLWGQCSLVPDVQRDASLHHHFLNAVLQPVGFLKWEILKLVDRHVLITHNVLMLRVDVIRASVVFALLLLRKDRRAVLLVVRV